MTGLYRFSQFLFCAGGFRACLASSPRIRPSLPRRRLGLEPIESRYQLPLDQFNTLRRQRRPSRLFAHACSVIGRLACGSAQFFITFQSLCYSFVGSVAEPTLLPRWFLPWPRGLLLSLEAVTPLYLSRVRTRSHSRSSYVLLVLMYAVRRNRRIRGYVAPLDVVKISIRDSASVR